MKNTSTSFMNLVYKCFNYVRHSENIDACKDADNKHSKTYTYLICYEYFVFTSSHCTTNERKRKHRIWRKTMVLYSRLIHKNLSPNSCLLPTPPPYTLHCVSPSLSTSSFTLYLWETPSLLTPFTH